MGDRGYGKGRETGGGVKNEKGDRSKGGRKRVGQRAGERGYGGRKGLGQRTGEWGRGGKSGNGYGCD